MDMSRLRIAFLAGMLGQGGAEYQLYFIIKTLCELGCRPDVYTFSQGEFWETPIRDMGIKVISITEHGRISRVVKLVGYIKQGNYDYIHSQHFYTNLYAVIVSWICKTNCIGSIRNNTLSEVEGMGFLGWLSLMLPKYMAVNSYTGIENAKKFLRKSNTLIFLPNFVDTRNFIPNNSNKDNKIFKVLTVGTVWKPKRIDRVIEVAELISQRCENIVFEIVGDGDQYDTMVELAKSKNLLKSTVFFVGRSHNIASVYKSADMLLLTSDHEGTPNVVLESMACGLPVLASRVGDVPELLLDGITGFTVEKTDITKMAEIIELLSKNRQLCVSIGLRAREYVLNNYSKERLLDGLSKLYFPTTFTGSIHK
jgi:glycosyltransferase involved in cell wall biosynthesis